MTEIIGLIEKYGEDDIALNILELPEEVRDKVITLVKPYCGCSSRGTCEQISDDVKEL